MLRLTSRITIGEYQFKNCVSVKIRSSWNELTDTCTLVLPRKVKWTKQDLVAGDQPSIAVGDAVTIELGYDFNYSTYFTGYIVSVGTKTPVEIECQDAFWFLKQVQHKKTYPKGTLLSDVLTDLQTVYEASAIYAKYKAPITFAPYGEIVGQTEISATEKTKARTSEIGALRCDNVTIAFILDTFKTKLSMPSWIRNNVVYTGLPYYENQRNTVERVFEYNIISEDMEYKREEDNKLQVVVKNIENKNIPSVTVGDADGDKIDWLVSGITTEAQMREIGEEVLSKRKYTGWFGSFTTFGDTYIKHGDVISLIDKKIKDRNGMYYVKGTDVEFGINGFRITPELERKFTQDV